MSGVRTFIGIPLPDDVLEALTAACAAVRTGDATWESEKWVPRENLHITLKFVGNVAEDSLEQLADAVQRVAAAHSAFALPGPNLIAVPSARRARMLWAAFLDPEGKCAALAAELDHACLESGAQLEEREFKPHVTLVRARAPRPLSEVAVERGQEIVASVPDAVSVRSITLFSSRLTPKGPLYAVLRESMLATG